MSDFASIIEKQMNSFFGNTIFDDFIHKELVPLSHLKERHASWTLEVDLPLVDKKNIVVTLSDDHLAVKAKLTKTYSISRGATVTEFDYFKKTIKLPSGINTKQISANFNNGILKITMPKPADGKNISVE
ncbi:MAG: Hsp20/alpha crystallin family protein [Nitrosotalea sp.]